MRAAEHKGAREETEKEKQGGGGRTQRDRLQRGEMGSTQRDEEGEMGGGGGR